MKTKALLYILLCILIVLLGVVYAIETNILQETIISIRSEALSRFFGTSYVVQLTDLHFTGMGWRERQMLEAVDSIHPALIMMTGDYVNGGVDFRQLRECLRRLRAIAPIIAILGNNDDVCRDSLRLIFDEIDITLLENQTARLVRSADSLYIVGTGDNTRWRDNYYLAAKGLTGGDRRIVLAHAPALAEMIDSSGVELILSGHLHGGQIVLPWIGGIYSNRTPYVSKVYWEGLYTVHGMMLYSNRGIGTSDMPVRFLARPEIAVFSFVGSESGERIESIRE